MTADETNQFQVLIAQYRKARAAHWAAVQAWRLFTAEIVSLNALGAELEAPAEAIPYDSRQGAKSIFATDPSWNALINEKAFAAEFLTKETTTCMTMNKAAIGADVAY
jgi:hypothetical protein